MKLFRKVIEPRYRGGPSIAHAYTSTGCLPSVSLFFDFPLSGILREGRTERGRENEPPVVVGEKIGASRARKTEFRECERAGLSCERSRESERAERAVRGERDGPGDAVVSMATRRGGNATVTMAAAGSSLGPTCLSLFLASRPPRSPHLDLFLPPTERANGRADAAPLEPICKGKVGRTWARASSREKGFYFFFSFPPSFRAASRESFFPYSGASSRSRCSARITRGI